MGVTRRASSGDTVPMGWCLPYVEDHDKCRVQYTDWNGNERKCSCTCHESPKSRKTKRTAKNDTPAAGETSTD